MPDIDSYKFSHLEILELLLKSAEVHDGEWMLQVNFGFSAGNFGPDDKNVNPGAIAVINHIGIIRAKPDSPAALVLDAAKVNPDPPTAS